MKIQKEWSAFRLTLLLYSIVLIIPLTFYFLHTSFNTAQDDTKVIRQVGWLEGVSESLAIAPSPQFNQQMVKNVDDTIQKISIWVTQNNDSEFYIGGKTLSKDLSDVTSCWTLYKQKLSEHSSATVINGHSTKCMDTVKNLTIIIENMVYLKQDKLINMFYWNLAVAMFLSLLMIYMVRSYIQNQMKKHAIHDHETKLFNKKYFLSQLETSCARSVRNKSPLSVLSISIDDFGKGSNIYDEKTKEHILGMLGGLITSLTRTSDTACRYDEDHFSILLPDTKEESALILERRVREVFEKHDFMAKPELKFKFSTTQFNNEETSEAFITRTETLLK